jgi:phage terminase large subunit
MLTQTHSKQRQSISASSLIVKPLTGSDPLFLLSHWEERPTRAKCCWCQQPLVSIMDGRMWRCRNLVCFERQMVHAMGTRTKKGIEFLYIPLPIQTVFHEAVLAQKHRRILFGGAAGVSKSHALRWLGHSLCMKYDGFKVLLLRRKLPQLEESHISRIQPEMQAIRGDNKGYKVGDRIAEYPTGSRLKFGHCNEKGDEVNYLSDEYDLILFDEETTFLESQIVLISSRARTARVGWQPIVAGGTNPGGIAANYCLSHYIHKNPDPHKYPHYRPDDYLYIAGTLDDNPYLNETYEQSLDDLPTELREAYRFGNWDIFPGQFFKEWRKREHCAQLVVPSQVERFCSMDWGYLRPGVCLWWAALPDGRFYVEDEYTFTETVAADVAKEIRRRNKERGIKVRYCAADPAMWIRSGETGESLAETFAKNGWPLRQAKNERVNGWQRVRALLRSAPDERGNSVPWLRVNDETCPYLCRTLPQLVSDDAKPEDVDTSGEDHAADALRYGAMSRPYATNLSRSHPLGKNTAGHLFTELRRSHEHE